MYLFFDTETTGIPKDYKAPVEDLDNWPRIIQLAFQVYDEDQRLTFEFCELIKPEGWEVPSDKFWIDNGFSTEKCQERGVYIGPAIHAFLTALRECDHLIAHNYNFDKKILRAEFLRLKLDWFYKALNSLEYERFCTMFGAAKLPIVKDYFGKYKWPKLEELYTILFGEDFEGAHDALADVKACAKCYFEMANRGLIEPKI